MSNDIMIVCEHKDKEFLPITKELFHCANLLAKHYKSKITLLMPTFVPLEIACPEYDLMVVDSPYLAEYTCEGWEQAALLGVEEVKPDIIIIAHSSTGYDYAPRLAAKLDGSCISSVSAIEIRDDKVFYRRSGLYGKLDLLYDAVKRPLVITVLPGAFPAYEPLGGEGICRNISADIKLKQTSKVEYSLLDIIDTELDYASVVVAAGRGIGKEENLDLIKDLASCFNRSAVAGSRIVCDKGWLPYSSQIGITGKKVSPPLYIACGISGSAQHIAGMKEAKMVVSINWDSEAAIHRYSDISVVEDLVKFIPEFIRKCEKT
ncbi:MAG: electron transfer flavoprotein subunit alpha/FixB family protein [Syntrophomonadaceae bacterium]|nr:electron transfer flavoprotein subunit alpha/FixB family protein [Syntrophomonadaceae bacterium]